MMVVDKAHLRLPNLLAAASRLTLINEWASFDKHTDTTKNMKSLRPKPLHFPVHCIAS
jgi:hypothetical protein